jgi:hypothetical protein
MFSRFLARISHEILNTLNHLLQSINFQIHIPDYFSDFDSDSDLDSDDSDIDLSFILACRDNDLQKAAELLSNIHVDPSSADNEAFRLVCKNGSTQNHIEVLQLLLSDDRIDPSCLMLACRNDNLEVVKILVRDSRVDISVGLKSADGLIREYLLWENICRDYLSEDLKWNIGHAFVEIINQECIDFGS